MKRDKQKRKETNSGIIGKLIRNKKKAFKKLLKRN
jgi:hypothetical protein